MATSYGTLCDDFYVNMTLNTELDLPTNRDTILHFFERIQRQYPTMSSFYQRPTGEFCLDEDRETGSYRWVAVETNRICAGFVNPESLEECLNISDSKDVCRCVTFYSYNNKNKDLCLENEDCQSFCLKYYGALEDQYTRTHEISMSIWDIGGIL